MTRTMTPSEAELTSRGVFPVACPKCDRTATRERLATLRPDGMAHSHACMSCDWRNDLCATCHEPMRWDPDARGTTMGGLDLIGALVCCSTARISKCSRPASGAAGDEWSIAKGGRSLNAGGIRIRAEGKVSGETVALMERLVRLPDLEREVDELRGIRGVTSCPLRTFEELDAAREQFNAKAARVAEMESK